MLEIAIRVVTSSPNVLMICIETRSKLSKNGFYRSLVRITHHLLQLGMREIRKERGKILGIEYHPVDELS